MVLNKEWAWVLLFVCAVIESGWALLMKYTDGFTKPIPTVVCLALAALNIFLLSLVFKFLPVGVAYTIWVCCGIVGAVIGAYFLFGEKISTAQMFFIAVTMAGVVGIKLVSGNS